MMAKGLSMGFGGHGATKLQEAHVCQQKGGGIGATRCNKQAKCKNIEECGEGLKNGGSTGLVKNCRSMLVLLLRFEIEKDEGQHGDGGLRPASLVQRHQNTQPVRTTTESIS